MIESGRYEGKRAERNKRTCKWKGSLQEGEGEAGMKTVGGAVKQPGAVWGERVGSSRCKTKEAGTFDGDAGEVTGGRPLPTGAHLPPSLNSGLHKQTGYNWPLPERKAEV